MSTSSGSPEQQWPASMQYPRGLVTLWLGAAALAALFVLLFASLDALQGDVLRLQAAIAELNALRLSPITVEELEALRAMAINVTGAEDLVEGTLAEAGQQGLPWLAILQRVVPTPPSEVQLASLTQSQDRIELRGTVASEPALAAYVARLRGSLLFDDVQVESATSKFAVSLRVKAHQP